MGASEYPLCEAHAGVMALMADFASHLEAWRSLTANAAAAIQQVHQQAAAVQSDLDRKGKFPGETLRKVALQAPSAALTVYMKSGGKGVSAQSLSDSMASLSQCEQRAPKVFQDLETAVDAMQQVAIPVC